MFAGLLDFVAVLRCAAILRCVAMLSSWVGWPFLAAVAAPSWFF